MIMVLSLEALCRADGSIIPERRVLFESLRAGSIQTVLLSLIPSETVHQALRRERIEHDVIVCKPTTWYESDTMWKIHAVTNLLAASHRISFYLDVDPVACRTLREYGITSLLLEGRVALHEQALTHQHEMIPWDERAAQS